MAHAYHAPKHIRVDRDRGVMRFVWPDEEISDIPLAWLRANCPCATCRTRRAQPDDEADALVLNVTPAPSAEIVDLELVGGYAVRPTWEDGHNTGLYAFAWLYERRTAHSDQENGAPAS